MKSSSVELKLPLGDFLTIEVKRMAEMLGLSVESWMQSFLAKGRLTPEVERDLGIAHDEGYFLPNRR